MSKEENKKNNRKFIGTVVSDAENKTIRVEVERTKAHPLYEKRYGVTKNFAVHDEENEAVVGDEVEFEECRPISKMKRWRLTKILS